MNSSSDFTSTGSAVVASRQVALHQESLSPTTSNRHIADPAVRQVTIVLPAYNEGGALPPLLGSIQRSMAEAAVPYHVIVVDDGSGDGTARVAEVAAEDMPLQLIKHPQNRGLAAAWRTGLTAAAAVSGPDDVIVTMDSDNTHPPELIHDMLPLVDSGHNVVIASLYREGSQIVGVPPFRRLMSFGARCMFQILLPIHGVRSYTSGYRAYRAGLLQEALAHYGDEFVTESGFSSTVDILLKLRRFGISAAEVPLVLRYDQKGGVSKMPVARTIRQTLSLIARRRWEDGLFFRRALSHEANLPASS